MLYVDKEGFIRRLDYRVEIAGNAPAAHYLADYRLVSGIAFATKRVVYQWGEDKKPRLDAPVVVYPIKSNRKARRYARKRCVSPEIVKKSGIGSPAGIPVKRVLAEDSFLIHFLPLRSTQTTS